MARSDERQQFIGDITALGAELADRLTVVLGRPGDHGVGEEGEADLLRLVLEVRPDDGALLGVVQVPAQRVQTLPFC